MMSTPLSTLHDRCGAALIDISNKPSMPHVAARMSLDSRVSDGGRSGLNWSKDREYRPKNITSTGTSSSINTVHPTLVLWPSL